MDPVTAIAVWGASLVGIVELVSAARRVGTHSDFTKDAEEE
jgi:hypothetical protein